MYKFRGSNHIEDMIEWGQKQYTPWEYAREGKMPPYLKAEGNKKRAAIIFFVQGIIATLITVLTLLNDQNHGKEWLQLVIPVAIAILCFLVAANYLKQWKDTKLNKVKTKNLIKKEKT